jgi:tyrosine-protein kinase Etk/Wzc
MRRFPPAEGSPDRERETGSSRSGDGEHAVQPVQPSWIATERDGQLAAALRRDSTRHESTLAELAQMLAARRGTFFAVAGAILALAVGYLVLAPPVYETSILIHVGLRERPVPAFEEELTDLFETRNPTEGEMRILRSRTLLESVVSQLGLEVDARPRTFPVLGGPLARAHGGNAPAPARFGLEQYAWGGERIRVSAFTVSDALLGRPVILTALEGGRFRVATTEGAQLAEGTVGTPVTGSAGGVGIDLHVAELVARPGTEFVVTKRHRLDVIGELQRNVRIAEQGRNTGLVMVSLAGPEPSRISAVLDALARDYLRLSVERTSAKAAKTLEVLEAQLPVLKANVDKAEQSFNAFRQEHGTTGDLSLEAQSTLARMGEIDRAIADNDLQRADLGGFTERHPLVEAHAKKAARLRAQRAAMEARMRRLPELELATARLARQVRAATDLYTLLSNRAEELRVVKSGWIGDAQIVEQAVTPNRPSGPNARLVLIIASVLGLIGGIAAALGRNAFDRGAKDAEEIESGAGIRVIATIPRSAAQRRLSSLQGRGRIPPLAVASPRDAAVEELRRLRTSVEYALLRARNNVVAIGGLAPNAGKSVVSVNLAHLLAAAQGRVLLVDADLRRGCLHRYFGLEGRPGLAEVVTGAVPLEGALHHTDHPNLDVLPTGKLPADPAELLAGAAFEALLPELGRRYRAVVVDTAPILAVTDGALVGRHAGVNLIVIRAGEHPVGEVRAALREYAQDGVVVHGAVLNDVTPASRRYGRSGHYRRYELVRTT